MTTEQAVQPEATPFKYERPGEVEAGKKKFVTLCRTDILYGAVQVLNAGGENNLHSHSTMDGFWMVVSGRVRFYGENDALLGEFGPYEGMLVPRNTPYWFESAGDGIAELLQVEAIVAGQKVDRIDHQARKPGQTEF
jgi:mannose-6-phosphate isomerase-like protein (cupin superfamily)